MSTRGVRRDLSFPYATVPLVAIGLAYGNALYGPLVFDDVPALAAAREFLAEPSLGNLFVGADPGATTAGRPLLLLSLVLNLAVTGESPWGFHALNIGLHGLAALVLQSLLVRAFERGDAGESAQAHAGWLATAAATLWALHPLQPAAVSYVVQRAEIIAALCCLVALRCLLAGLTSAAGTRWRLAALAACLLGVLTKESAAIAPVLLLLYDRLFVSPSWTELRRARGVFYLGLAGVWLVQAALLVATAGRGGTAGFDSPVGPFTYLLTQCNALVLYLRLIVWPTPLIFDYGTATVRHPADAAAAAALLLPAVIAIGGAVVRRRRWSFLPATFLLLLAPSSSIVPVASQTVAEHRLYLALAAPVVAAVLLAHRIRARPLGIIAGAASAALVLTFLRNATYATPLRLWSDTAAKLPHNARAQHNLGLAALENRQFETALRPLQKAAELDSSVPDVHHNLGVLLSRLQRPADALQSYDRALGLQPHHPGALLNSGVVLLHSGRLDEALARFRAAIAADRTSADAHRNLAETLLRQGRPAEALGPAGDSVRLTPNSADAQLTLGNALAATGQLTAALQPYERALQLAPDDARIHNNLGNVRLQLDQPSVAIGHYERALALTPTFVEPRRNLALLLLHLGRHAAAEEHLAVLQRALPADPEIRDALARARRRR